MAISKDDEQRTIYLPKRIGLRVEGLAKTLEISWAAAARLLIMQGLGEPDVADALADIKKDDTCK